MKTMHIDEKCPTAEIARGFSFLSKLAVILMLVPLLSLVVPNDLSAQATKRPATRNHQSTQVQPATTNTTNPTSAEPPHSPPLMDIKPDAKPAGTPAEPKAPVQHGPAPAPQRGSGRPR